MNKITNITIQNIKGFGAVENSFDVEILSGKINIIVAPNGFGKSSITVAFNSLKSNKLELETNNYHKGDTTLMPSLSIVEGGMTYVANSTKNEISQSFKVFCIKNMLNAIAVGKNMGKFFSTTGYLSIDSIEIMKVPKSVDIHYSITNIRKRFGSNGKILPNLGDDILNDNLFWGGLSDLYVDLEKFDTIKRKKEIKDIVSSINSMSGTKGQIIENFDGKLLQNLKTESCYTSIINYISRFKHDLTDLELFSYFYEIQLIYFDSKPRFKEFVKRSNYEYFKENFNSNLSILGNTWKAIEAVEEKGTLVVNFPHATDISYGQRDVLTLCILLQKIRLKIKNEDKIIIILDEVFDYLDAANMTATQYYFSEILNEFNKYCVVYPIIMTHLNPEHFRNYVFSPKKMNIQYLKKTQAKPSINMRKLLAKREDSVIKDDVAKNLFHYSTNEISKRAEFRNLGLPELWGEGTNFLQYIIEETNKYLEGSVDFEPYAVCTALRINIEKSIYDKLPDSVSKKIFLDTHKTKSKLEFAETILGELPDIYYMLGIIYNDAEHIKDENSDKPIIYRLNHILIKDMIKNVLGYNDVPINITSIH